MELCNLLKNEILPKEELQRVFRESETASAEIDLTFLCFEEQYEYVRDHTDTDDIIIDLGCGYNAQCFYFKDCERYIAVDLPFENNVRFDSGNVEFYLESIQDFLAKDLPHLIEGGLDLSRCVAICNAVPDFEAQDMVERTFPRHYIWYPGQIAREAGLKEKEMEEERE